MRGVAKIVGMSHKALISSFSVCRIARDKYALVAKVLKTTVRELARRKIRRGERDYFRRGPKPMRKQTKELASVNVLPLIRRVIKSGIPSITLGELTSLINQERSAGVVFHQRFIPAVVGMLRVG